MDLELLTTVGAALVITNYVAKALALPVAYNRLSNGMSEHELPSMKKDLLRIGILPFPLDVAYFYSIRNRED